MQENRQTAREGASSHPGERGGAREPTRRQGGASRAAAYAATPLHQLQGTLTQVEELIAAVQEEAAVLRARAEDEARAIRTAAAAEAARERAEFDRQRQEAEVEIARQRAEIEQLRRDAEEQAAQERAELDRLRAEVLAERARLEQVLERGVQAVAAVQSALLFDTGPLAAPAAAAVEEAVVDQEPVEPPTVESGRRGVGRRSAAAAREREGEQSGAASEVDLYPLAQPAEDEPTPTDDGRAVATTDSSLSIVPSDESIEPDEAAAVAAEAVSGADQLARADERLQAGDVSGALDLFAAMTQDAEQRTIAIARLSALVNDDSLEAYHDRALELLAEAYLQQAQEEPAR